MNNEIVIALIGAGSAFFVGVLSFLGVVLTNKRSSKDIERKLEVAQAVTDTKIEELTREVRKHNNFAQRMPVVENDIKHLLDDERHMRQEIDHLKTFHEGR